ncbi:MAG: hypothetical protein VKM34_05590 [Cyanobacteriota bacterium]|nr:hypothetical protein [Cyanobacteriota bacterium]
MKVTEAKRVKEQQQEKELLKRLPRLQGIIKEAKKKLTFMRAQAAIDALFS